MKARRVLPGAMCNPFFSHAAKRAAREKNLPYTVPPLLTLPVGEQIDDPDCYKLCLGPNPPCVPDDRECAEAVLKAMTHPTRIAFLKNLQRQNHPDVRKQMPKAQIEWLDAMLELYGDEMERLDRPPAGVPADGAGR